MMDWTENNNGNYVAEDEDYEKVTVFIDKRGQWRGIREERITEFGYSTAEEAMSAIDKKQVDFVKIRAKADTTDWKPAKKGGFYRLRHAQIITVKQARNGSWYISIEGKLVENRWFQSSKEAARCADSLHL
jgi:hypothetical protein